MAAMKFLSVIAALFAVSVGFSADKVIQPGKDTTLISERHTNGFKPKPLTPGPDDSRIARVAAAILERNHYLQQSIDDSVSEKFLEKYLDALDPAHLVFFQSDEAEF